MSIGARGLLFVGAGALLLLVDAARAVHSPLSGYTTPEQDVGKGRRERSSGEGHGAGVALASIGTLGIGCGVGWPPAR